jgi:NitT/TauT family transport system permease protein
MGLVLTYTNKVRQAMKDQASVGVDLILLVALAGIVAALAMMFGQADTSMNQPVVIDLSLWALPKYTLFSLMRGVAAYILSLVFTLVYGTIAAHNHRAEKLMIPALDILQSVPVLGFLPGLVLAMIALFPRHRFGLELACVVMIFTAQVWNMTFSFHGSLRSIPTALREAAALQGLSGWQIFKLLEVPAAMIGLVWNSMMSMAGGWFFLTVNEAFKLTIHGVQHDFRLPGIGSYMSQAIEDGNVKAEIGAVVAMMLMIILVDQVFWRPIVVWSQRFKLEDTAAADVPHSWVANMFKHSRMLNVLSKFVRRRHQEREQMAPKPVHHDDPEVAAAKQHNRDMLRKIASWITVAILFVLAVWGAIRLGKLFLQLPIHDPTPGIPWTERQDWITVFIALLASFARVAASVLLGVAWTLPVGILIGLSPRLANRLQPVTQVLASFPAPMLFPLVVALVVVKLQIPFTIGCVALMLLGAQWYILFNVIAGATAIPAELKEAGTLYNMPTRQRWTRLYLPSVFPYLVTGLITAAGGAWNATIVAEYITVSHTTYKAFGLGAIIFQASDGEQYATLAASVVVMSLFVVLLNRVIWKRLYRLAESRYTLNV